MRWVGAESEDGGRYDRRSMCGFAGIFRLKGGSETGTEGETVWGDRGRAMLAAVRHRGPDEEGVWSDGRCLLVHARLAVIDPAGGRQPMRLAGVDGVAELVVVFNGEIYNHRALRQELEGLGHRFVTDHCDTEVLLHGYRQWREGLVERLEGMFSFVIWEPGSARLFLARDRIGKKPLFYQWVSVNGGREFLFGSLISAIRAGWPVGFSTSVDAEALGEYLRWGYTGCRTLLKGVEELEAGSWMVVEAGGSVRRERYWQPPRPEEGQERQMEVGAMLEILRQAVGARLEADVPLGCFLSGGIDSSVVAALAQEELKKEGAGPLHTFSVAMPVLAYDETPKAIAVARHIGAVHECLYVRAGLEAIEDLAFLIGLSGEPTADSSILPTYWLSRAVRERVKVVLSGDGGDEIFGGYDRYRALRLLGRHRWWLANMPAGLGRRGDAINPWAWAVRWARLVQAARGSEPAEQYARMIQIFQPEQVAELAPDLPRPGEILPDWPGGADAVRSAMWWDLRHYLPFDVLRKVDRASMAVALEVRCPLLDRAVCEWAGRLSSGVLMPGGRAKGLLREAAKRLLPGWIVKQKKRGFALPIGVWFRQELAGPVRECLLESRLEDLGLDRRVVSRLIDEHGGGVADHTHRLFGLLSLALWWKWLRSGSGQEG